MFGLLARRRAERRELARLALIDELFEHVNAAEPCGSDDCHGFRARVRELCKPGDPGCTT